MSRILVDISPLWRPLEWTPPDVWDAQRLTAIGVLHNDKLDGLPVLVDNEALYALDPESTLQWLSTIQVSLPTPALEIAEAHANQSQSGRGRLVGARQLARQLRSIVGRTLVSVAPGPARPELREVLHHAEKAVRLWLRPPPSPSPPLRNASHDRPALTLRIYPGPEDLLWTCGPCRGSPALRWLAEVKGMGRFRVGSLCLGVDGVATIDQLDAADVLVCQSSAIREELNELAAQSGRAAPNARVLSVGLDLAEVSSVDELINTACEDLAMAGAVAR